MPQASIELKRNDIWTVSGGGGYTGKPRPAVILQADEFDETGSITICAFTTDPTDAPLFRLVIEPTAINGLHSPSRLMVDKITTIPKTKLGTRQGCLSIGEVTRLNRAILVFLGLT